MANLTKNEKYIVDMYVRYFGKAPSVAEIAKYNEFGKPKLILNEIRGDADDSKAGLTTEEFVNNAFQNLFGRDATTKEMNKYSKVVDKGKDLPINAIVKAAKKSDKGVYEAKNAIAIMLAEKDNATIYNLDKITKDTYADVYDVKTKKLLVDSVAQLETKIDAMPDNATVQTLNLTTGVDTLVGTAENDTFTANLAFNASTNKLETVTLNSLDVLDGGAGVDTLNFYSDNAAAGSSLAGTISNIENINIVSGAGVTVATSSTITGVENISAKAIGGAVSIDTKSDVKSVTVTGSATTVAINDAGTAGATTADKIATISVSGNSGAVTIGTAGLGNTLDSLTTFNYTNSNQSATITAAAGTRDLTLNLNKITGGTITDDNATGLTVNNTGAESTLTIAAAAAKAITINADEKLNLTALNDAVVETLTVKGDSLVTISTSTFDTALLKSIDASASTGGLKLATADVLATTTSFAGSSAADAVAIGATTKAITMGAGDDVVTVNVALGANGTVSGGDGVDTLSMSSALAATLSATDTFSKAVDGFEKITIGAVAANTTDIVKLNNLDNIDYVVSAGNAAGGTNETSAITFNGLDAGTSITIAGRTVTATSGNATAAQVADAFATGTTAGTLTVTGALASWTAGAAAGNTVTFTSTTVGNVTDLAPTFTAVAAPVVPSVSTTNGTGSTDETAVVTFTDLLIGQSVIIDGLTIAATSGNATAAQVAAAVSGGTAGTLTVSGALASWTAGAAAGSTVTFTSTTPNSDITPNLLPTVSGTAATTVTNSSIAGTAGSALEIESMTNNGTLELTGVIAGSTTVKMKDATGTADTLNIKLNGTANIVNTGTLTVAGVETININATDSSVDTVTLTNPSAVSKINLVAVDATKIVVAGNHGVDFTGSTLTKVTTLDASGVVATGATATATAAQIATAGAVTFTSVVTDKAVTVTTGNGNDTINLASVTDATKGSSTVTTGAGDDIITGTAGKDVINAGDGKDTIYATGSADTITLGAGNDTYVLGTATNSVLAKADKITDFSANTKAFGTTAADIAKGATTTAADLTGDTINVSFAIAAANTAVAGTTTGISVYVAANASDAQTFLQNTGTAGTMTGFALDSSTGNLYLDFDSNGTVDSVIQLTGVTTITEAAFVTGIA